MDSKDEKSDKEERTVSSQVLEYYQNYSQSKFLPKYLCGSDTQLSPEPKLGQSNLRKDHYGLDIEQTSFPVNTIPVITIEEPADRPVSPTSSITSTKRLEWDSGADIGYENYQKHKFVQRSVSLPILTKLGHADFQRNILRLTPEGDFSSSCKIKSPGDETQDTQEPTKPIILTSSSEGSCKNFEKPSEHISSSTTSSVDREKNIISSSTSSDKQSSVKEVSTESDSNVYSQPKSFDSDLLKSIKKRMGFPVAESTPIGPLRKSDPICHVKSLTKEGMEEPCTSSGRQTIESSHGEPRKQPKFSPQDSNNASLKGYCSLNRSKRWKSYSDLSIDKTKLSQYRKKKASKLTATTPIVIDCVNYQKVSDKVVQTTLTRNSSASIKSQSKDSKNNSDLGIKDINDIKVPDEQFCGHKVIYVTHSESGKESYISSCNSFEYLSGEAPQKNKQRKEKSSTDSSGGRHNEETEIQPTLKENNVPPNVRCSSAPSNVTNITSDSDKNSSVDTIPTLGELISNKQSSHLIPDIEKSIHLLQKLVKSKKYDEITKKYYVKKIVQKIVNSNYADDSSSVDKGITDSTESKSERTDSGKSTTTKSISSDPGGEQNIQEIYLHENVPWNPANIVYRKTHAKPNSQNNLKTQTFTSEIVPNLDLLHGNEEVKVNTISKGTRSEVTLDSRMRNSKSKQPKRSHFTVSNNTQNIEAVASQPISPTLHGNSSVCGNYSENFAVSSNHVSTAGSSLKDSKDQSKNSTARSWKDDKTLSEKLYEEQLHKKHDRSDGDNMLISSDHLLNFAKKERETQINWINNEISHLSKLKTLLEKNNHSKEDKTKSILHNVLCKPQIKEFKGIQKSTAVYVITTEKTGRGSDSSQDSSKLTKPMSPSSSDKDKINFHLYNALGNEKEYKFKETIAQTSSVNPNKIVRGQINVDIKKGGAAHIEVDAGKFESSGSSSPAPEYFNLPTSCPTKIPCFCKDQVANVEEFHYIDSHPKEERPKLLASQTYFMKNHPQACVKRYVFEIPISADCQCQPKGYKKSPARDTIIEEVTRDSQQEDTQKKSDLKTTEKEKEEKSYPPTGETKQREVTEELFIQRKILPGSSRDSYLTFEQRFKGKEHLLQPGGTDDIQSSTGSTQRKSVSEESESNKRKNDDYTWLRAVSDSLIDTSIANSSENKQRRKAVESRGARLSSSSIDIKSKDIKMRGDKNKSISPKQNIPLDVGLHTDKIITKCRGTKMNERMYAEKQCRDSQCGRSGYCTKGTLTDEQKLRMKSIETRDTSSITDCIENHSMGTAIENDLDFQKCLRETATGPLPRHNKVVETDRKTKQNTASGTDIIQYSTKSTGDDSLGNEQYKHIQTENFQSTKGLMTKKIPKVRRCDKGSSTDMVQTSTVSVGTEDLNPEQQVRHNSTEMDYISKSNMTKKPKKVRTFSKASETDFIPLSTTGVETDFAASNLRDMGAQQELPLEKNVMTNKISCSDRCAATDLICYCSVGTDKLESLKKSLGTSSPKQHTKGFMTKKQPKTQKHNRSSVTDTIDVQAVATDVTDNNKNVATQILEQSSKGTNKDSKSVRYSEASETDRIKMKSRGISANTTNVGKKNTSMNVPIRNDVGLLTRKYKTKKGDKKSATDPVESKDSSCEPTRANMQTITEFSETSDKDSQVESPNVADKSSITQKQLVPCPNLDSGQQTSPMKDKNVGNDVATKDRSTIVNRVCIDSSTDADIYSLLNNQLKVDKSSMTDVMQYTDGISGTDNISNWKSTKRHSKWIQDLSSSLIDMIFSDDEYSSEDNNVNSDSLRDNSKKALMNKLLSKLDNESSKDKKRLDSTNKWMRELSNSLLDTTMQELEKKQTDNRYRKTQSRGDPDKGRVTGKLDAKKGKQKPQVKETPKDGKKNDFRKPKSKNQRIARTSRYDDTKNINTSASSLIDESVEKFKKQNEDDYNWIRGLSISLIDISANEPGKKKQKPGRSSFEDSLNESLGKDDSTSLRSISNLSVSLSEEKYNQLKNKMKTHKEELYRKINEQERNKQQIKSEDKAEQKPQVKKSTKEKPIVKNQRITRNSKNDGNRKIHTSPSSLLDESVDKFREQNIDDYNWIRGLSMSLIDISANESGRKKQKPGKRSSFKEDDSLDESLGKDDSTRLSFSNSSVDLSEDKPNKLENKMKIDKEKIYRKMKEYERNKQQIKSEDKADYKQQLISKDKAEQKPQVKKTTKEKISSVPDKITQSSLANMLFGKKNDLKKPNVKNQRITRSPRNDDNKEIQTSASSLIDESVEKFKKHNEDDYNWIHDLSRSLIDISANESSRKKQKPGRKSFFEEDEYGDSLNESLNSSIDIRENKINKFENKMKIDKEKIYRKIKDDKRNKQQIKSKDKAEQKKNALRKPNVKNQRITRNPRDDDNKKIQTSASSLIDESVERFKKQNEDDYNWIRGLSTSLIDISANESNRRKQKPGRRTLSFDEDENADLLDESLGEGDSDSEDLSLEKSKQLKDKIRSDKEKLHRKMKEDKKNKQLKSKDKAGRKQQIKSENKPDYKQKMKSKDEADYKWLRSVSDSLIDLSVEKSQKAKKKLNERSDKDHKWMRTISNSLIDLSIEKSEQSKREKSKQPKKYDTSKKYKKTREDKKFIQQKQEDDDEEYKRSDDSLIDTSVEKSEQRKNKLYKKQDKDPKRMQNSDKRIETHKNGRKMIQEKSRYDKFRKENPDHDWMRSISNSLIDMSILKSEQSKKMSDRKKREYYRHPERSDDYRQMPNISNTLDDRGVDRSEKTKERKAKSPRMLEENVYKTYGESKRTGKDRNYREIEKASGKNKEKEKYYLQHDSSNSSIDSAIKKLKQLYKNKKERKHYYPDDNNLMENFSHSSVDSNVEKSEQAKKRHDKRRGKVPDDWIKSEKTRKRKDYVGKQDGESNKFTRNISSSLINIVIVKSKLGNYDKDSEKRHKTKKEKEILLGPHYKKDKKSKDLEKCVVKRVYSDSLLSVTISNALVPRDLSDSSQSSYLETPNLSNTEIKIKPLSIEISNAYTKCTREDLDYSSDYKRKSRKNKRVNEYTYDKQEQNSSAEEMFDSNIQTLNKICCSGCYINDEFEQSKKSKYKQKAGDNRFSVQKGTNRRLEQCPCEHSIALYHANSERTPPNSPMRKQKNKTTYKVSNGNSNVNIFVGNLIMDQRVPPTENCAVYRRTQLPNTPQECCCKEIIDIFEPICKRIPFRQEAYEDEEPERNKQSQSSGSKSRPTSGRYREDTPETENADLDKEFKKKQRENRLKSDRQNFKSADNKEEFIDDDRISLREEYVRSKRSYRKKPDEADEIDFIRRRSIESLEDEEFTEKRNAERYPGESDASQESEKSRTKYKKGSKKDESYSKDVEEDENYARTTKRMGGQKYKDRQQIKKRPDDEGYNFADVNQRKQAKDKRKSGKKGEDYSLMGAEDGSVLSKNKDYTVVDGNRKKQAKDKRKSDKKGKYPTTMGEEDEGELSDGEMSIVDENQRKQAKDKKKSGRKGKDYSLRGNDDESYRKGADKQKSYDEEQSSIGRGRIDSGKRKDKNYRAEESYKKDFVAEKIFDIENGSINEDRGYAQGIKSPKKMPKVSMDEESILSGRRKDKNKTFPKKKTTGSVEEQETDRRKFPSEQPGVPYYGEMYTSPNDPRLQIKESEKDGDRSYAPSNERRRSSNDSRNIRKPDRKYSYQDEDKNAPKEPSYQSDNDMISAEFANFPPKNRQERRPSDISKDRQDDTPYYRGTQEDYENYSRDNDKSSYRGGKQARNRYSQEEEDPEYSEYYNVRDSNDRKDDYEERDEDSPSYGSKDQGVQSYRSKGEDEQEGTKFYGKKDKKMEVKKTSTEDGKDKQFKKVGTDEEYGDGRKPTKSQGAQTEKKEKYSSSSTQSETSSSSSSEEVCQCCKRREYVRPYATPETYDGVTQMKTNYFCQPCNMYYGRQAYYYSPGHVCNCYTMVKTQEIGEIRRTVDQLDKLYQEDLRCTCSKNSKKCPRCSCKNKSRKNKGVAYMLKFEETSVSENNKDHHKKNKNLEEVTIKIPVPPHKKRGKRHSKSHNSDNNDSAKENTPKKSKKDSKKKRYSLQDYLFSNRPDFVESAEERRRCMIELAYMREQRNDKFKQLLALTNGLPVLNNNDKPKRMFSPKEMKQMTAKKYKKLPEVQQKLLDNKKKQIKKANRMLADIFNKRLRDQVLKGKTDIPSDASVIKLI